MPDINMQVFEEAKRNQLVTEVDIQTQVALDDYQIQLSDIANPTQSQDNVVIDRHGEFLPHWNESLDFDTWVKMSMEVAGKKLLMIHGNVGLSNVSSISGTFMLGEDFADSDITDNFNVIGSPTTTYPSDDGGTVVDIDDYGWVSKTGFSATTGFILEGRRYLVGTGESAPFGLADHDTPSAWGDIFGWTQDSLTVSAFIEAGSYVHATGAQDRVYHDVKFVVSASNSIDCYLNGENHYTETSFNPVSTDFYVHLNRATAGAGGGRNNRYNNIRVRQYTTAEPTHTIGTPKNISTALKLFGRAG